MGVKKILDAQGESRKTVDFLGVEFPESEFIVARNEYEEWLDFVANGGNEKHDNETLVQVN